MQSTESLWSRAPSHQRHRPRIATIIVVLLLAAAVAEPVIMYLKLAHQKEQRREAAELTLPVKAERAPAVQ